MITMMMMMMIIIITIIIILPDKCKNKQSITAQYEVLTAVLLKI